MQIQCTWTYRDFRFRPALFSTFSKHWQSSIGYVATRGGRGALSFVATMSSVSTQNNVVSTQNTQPPLQVLTSTPCLLVGFYSISRLILVMDFDLSTYMGFRPFFWGFHTRISNGFVLFVIWFPLF